MKVSLPSGMLPVAWMGVSPPATLNASALVPMASGNDAFVASPTCHSTSSLFSVSASGAIVLHRAGTKDSGNRERVTLRAQAFELLHQTLPLDMGGVIQNAELKCKIAHTLVQVGMRERALGILMEALAIPVGNIWEKSKLAFDVGTALLQDRFYDEALAIDTGIDGKTGELKRDVGIALAQDGLFDRALAIDTGGQYRNVELKYEIGKVLAQAGMRKRACEVFEQALAIDMGGVTTSGGELQEEIRKMLSRVKKRGRTKAAVKTLLVMDAMETSGPAKAQRKIDTRFAELATPEQRDEALEQALMTAGQNAALRHEIGDALIVAEMFSQALAIDTGDDWRNGILKREIGEAMFQKACEGLKVPPVGVYDLWDLLPQASLRELLQLGKIWSMAEIRLAMVAVSQHRHVERTADALIAGHLSAWRMHDLSAEERSFLFRRAAQKISKTLHAEEALSIQALSLKALYHLQEMGEGGATSLLIDVGRKLLAEGRPDYTLFHLLTRCDSLKAKELALSAVSSGLFSERQSWLLLRQLVKSGYLDKNLDVFLNQRIAHAGEEKVKQARERSFLLQTIQYLHRELHLCPHVGLMRAVLQHAADMDAVRAVIEGVKQQQSQFDAIQDQRSLIAFLAQNEQAATNYFILYGGRTQYALVNNYDLGKFLNIVQKMHRLQVHEGPLAQFLELLPAEMRPGVREAMMRGVFPFSGESGEPLQIDVSNSGQREAMNQRAAQVFGSQELGAVIKLAMYAQSSELSAEERTMLEQVPGIGAAGDAIAKIECAHPQLAMGVADQLREKWKRLMAKRVLEVGIDAIFAHERNEVSLGRMIRGLDQARGVLANKVRQEFRKQREAAQTSAELSVEAARLERDQCLAALQEKARAKLLRYIVQDMLVGEGENEMVNRVFGEWESHLDHVLVGVEGLQEGPGVGRQERQVFVRFLKKRDDLVEYARVADSAQCCFNSKNYIIAHDHGAADWIAMLWADPLSFAFQIEEYPTTSPASAIGFVFGSFGIVDAKLAVLLNGVYLEGKTDVAAQAIVCHLEQEFSRKWGASSQVVASRHAGTSKMDATYSNAPIEVTRLRALKDPRSDGPISVIYDDLKVGVNIPGKTDEQVWHKALI